jgi:hypothetical protein
MPHQSLSICSLSLDCLPANLTKMHSSAHTFISGTWSPFGSLNVVGMEV